MESLVGMEGWSSSRCALTWRMKVTKYNRAYFQLQVSTPRTGVTGFGLSPTVTSVQRNHPERVRLLKRTGAKTMMSRNMGEERPNSILDHLNFYGLLPDDAFRDGKDSLLSPQYTAEMMGFPVDWLERPFSEGFTATAVQAKAGQGQGTVQNP